MKDIISPLLILGALLAGCDKGHVYEAPKYAIGTIVYYENHSSDPTVNFDFYADGQPQNYQYSTTPGRYVPHRKKWKKGDKFMVKYETGNYKQSKMLFECPVVNDSLDSANYAAQFLVTEPQ